MNVFEKFRHRFEVLRAVAAVTYKEWSAYRTHSMVSIFVGPVYFIVQYFIWTAVYSGHSSINGMELESMIRYFGVTVLIGYLTMDFADWNLQMLVRTGKFLTFALRPIHHRYFALSQKFGHRVLGFFFEFLPCLLIFTLLFRINLRPVYPLWTLISVALAFLMNFYVNYNIGMTAFFLVQSSGIRQVFGLLASAFSGVLIPLTFFPKWIQYLMFLLPFQYTAYVPAMVFTGTYRLAGIELSIPAVVGVQAGMLLLTIAFSELFYRLAIRRFTAVGA
jgi:ABC-2 type transport system permease protein